MFSGSNKVSQIGFRRVSREVYFKTPIKLKFGTKRNNEHVIKYQNLFGGRSSFF